MGAASNKNIDNPPQTNININLIIKGFENYQNENKTNIIKNTINVENNKENPYTCNINKDFNIQNCTQDEMKNENGVKDEDAPPGMDQYNSNTQENGKKNNTPFGNSTDSEIKSYEGGKTIHCIGDKYEEENKNNNVTPGKNIDINKSINESIYVDKPIGKHTNYGINEQKKYNDSINKDSAKDINNNKPNEDDEKKYTNDGNSQNYLSMSQSVILKSYGDLSVEINKIIFYKDINERMAKGYFPLFLKINEEKPQFFFVIRDSTLRSVLRHYLKDKNINESEDSFTLYNRNEELDIDKKIYELNLKPLTYIKNFK